MPKVLIGLNSYNDLPFLERVLPALLDVKKTLKEAGFFADIVLMDNAHNDSVKSYVLQNFPEISYLRHKDGNLGYGRSYNEILRLNLDALYKYFLLVTSDVLLVPESVLLFLKRMEKDDEIAMCSGKLYYFDFKNNLKTDRIDSFGIMAKKSHHFYDLGAGEIDKGQYDDKLETVFGVSGASFIIRFDTIIDVFELVGGLFDERMWMYKEDVDLSYKLRWLNKKLILSPEVFGYHARTVYNKYGHDFAGLLRAYKSKQFYSRKESYKNHILMLKNNFTFLYGFKIVAKTFLYEFAKAFYMLLRHPVVLFFGFKTLLFVSARRTPKRASVKKILSYLN